MRILAIETSCDETAVSVVDAGGGFRRPYFRIVSNVVASQIAIHKKWGGVVPNLAKREHEKHLVPTLKHALRDANLLKPKSKEGVMPAAVKNSLDRTLKRERELLVRTTVFFEKYGKPSIDLVAVTNGPGLEPALWVGINFAKALSLSWNKPLIAVNHMEGHLLSPLLTERGKQNVRSPKVKFPALALLVSGGHTELVLMKNWRQYHVLGATLDDAAGEAFDKVARMLELGYPGGPIIARLAERGKADILFPRPMLRSKDFDFSFSGLKTAVLYYLQQQRKPFSQKLKRDVAASFQQAAVDVLVAKTLRAAKAHGSKTVLIGGGVAANDALRAQLADTLAAQFPKTVVLFPKKSSTGDNGAMIGAAAYLRAIKKAPANPQTLRARGNLKITAQ